MNSFLRAAAATGLAAATIASGLTLGAPANAAPGARALAPGDTGARFQIIGELSNSTFAYIDANGYRATTSTFEDAKSKAGWVQAVFVKNSQNQNWWNLQAPGNPNRCYLSYYGNPVSYFHPSTASCRDGSDRIWNTTGGSLHDSNGWHLSPTAAGNSTTFAISRTVPVDAFKTLPNTLEALSASASSLSPENGTAVLTGHAPSGTDQVKVQWGDRTRYAVVDPETNTWTLQLSNLTIGSNPVSLTALAGAEVVATNQIDVNLTVADLSASVSLPADRSENAVVSGTGQPRAVIEIRHGSTLVGTTMADATTGAWSLEVPAPGIGGGYDLNVTQKVRNQNAGTTTATVPYGTAVSISDPVDGEQVDPTNPSVVFQGSGEKGAPLTITEKGHDAPVLASGAVNSSNGSYLLRTSDLEDREYKLVVTQHGKGNNVTTAEVTVNAGQHQDQDVTLTSPVSGSEFTPNTTLTFTGTGAPGGKITLIAGQGLADFTTTVDTAGNWTINRPMGGGAYTFTVKQEINGKTSTVDNIRLTPAGATVTKPFAVTSPESGSFHQNEVVTFTGTGTPGQTIELDPKNAGLATVTTIVGQNGNWSLNRYLGSGAYDFDVLQKNGGTVTGQVRNLRINQTADVSLPFAVTSPIDGSEHKGEMVTFTGTGTAGETITLHVTNFASSDVTTTVKADGSWSAQKYIGTGPYTIDITQKNAAGTTTGEKVGFKINQPAGAVNLPFEVTTPAEDTTFTPGGMFTFEGTGAADATVTVDPGQGLAKVTTTVKGNGHWSVQKFLGNGAYTFTISHTDGSGTVSKAPVTLTPTK